MKIKTKVSKSDVIKVLSATYIAPQWKETNIQESEQYINIISAETQKLDAILDVSSVNMAIYGEYYDQTMATICIKSFVWRYHNRTNPRQSAYGAAVFCNDQINLFRFDLKGYTDAKNLSDQVSKNLVDNLLE